MTSAARPSPEAMQDAGPPMALFLTEIVSRKSEHVLRWGIRLVERDLRPIWANINRVSVKWSAEKWVTCPAAPL